MILGILKEPEIDAGLPKRALRRDPPFGQHRRDPENRADPEVAAPARGQGRLVNVRIVSVCGHVFPTACPNLQGRVELPLLV